MNQMNQILQKLGLPKVDFCCDVEGLMSLEMWTPAFSAAGLRQKEKGPLKKYDGWLMSQVGIASWVARDVI